MSRVFGYDPEEIFQARVGSLAVRFAPQLRFDGGGGTCSAADTYPMSAQEYFERRSQGETGRLSNGDASTVTGNLVPTYWKAFRCGDQVRLVYWWFYGYQYECDCASGAHEGDWEHLLVVLSEDRIRARGRDPPGRLPGAQRPRELPRHGELGADLLLLGGPPRRRRPLAQHLDGAAPAAPAHGRGR
jgi:hypothetical protein